jgi:hypothetical protein
LKKYTTLFAVLIFSLIANAQDKLPSFGKIDKADLTMKDCDFDPGAEAIELIDVGELKFAVLDGTGWESEADYRIRIKILKASAVHRAEIKMSYYSRDRREDISNVSGISFNLDDAGNIVESKLEKKSIFYKSETKDYTELSFALPDVKVGTVFEYKYKRTRKGFYLPNWTFQQSIPVRYSAYNTIVPEYFQFTTQVIKRQEMEKKEDAYKGVWYIMRNVPSLKNEPYSSGRKDYLQRVEF